MRYTKGSIGLLLALCGLLILQAAAQAQTRCVLSGNSGRATGVARTCPADHAVSVAQSQAEAMVDQQVQCANLNIGQISAICRRQGLKADLSLFPGRIAPPKGYYRAVATFSGSCFAYRQTSKFAATIPGRCMDSMPLTVAKVQVMKACGVMCQP